MLCAGPSPCSQLASPPRSQPQMCSFSDPAHTATRPWNIHQDAQCVCSSSSMSAKCPMTHKKMTPRPTSFYATAAFGWSVNNTTSYRSYSSQCCLSRVHARRRLPGRQTLGDFVGKGLVCGLQKHLIDVVAATCTSQIPPSLTNGPLDSPRPISVQVRTYHAPSLYPTPCNPPFAVQAHIPTRK